MIKHLIPSIHRREANQYNANYNGKNALFTSANRRENKFNTDIKTFASEQFDQQQFNACLAQLAELSQESRWIVLINPPARFNLKQALYQTNVRMDRIRLLYTKDDVDSLWTMEKALTNGTASAVVAWANFDERDQRRLQLIRRELTNKGSHINGWLIAPESPRHH